MFRRHGRREQPEEEIIVDHPPGVLRELLVPSSILSLTLQGLCGYAPAEGLCYWFGRECGDGVGIVMVVAFPRIYSTERSFQLADGQMAHLTTWSQREGLWLLAQLHTHPTDEDHSQADEEWAATRREGFLSLVIPFSAQFSSVHQPRWRCFECDASGRWIRMDEGRLRIIDDVWLPKD